MSKPLRDALHGLVEAALPYIDKAAPHEQLFSGDDLRNFDRLGEAIQRAQTALLEVERVR